MEKDGIMQTMAEPQMGIPVAISLLGVASNVALYLYATNRIDNLADKIGTLNDRVGVLLEFEAPAE
jgi:hypothetical protein